MIDTAAKDKQKLIDIDEFEWNDYYEKINDLMLQEKKCRQTNDTTKGAEICVQIVSLSLCKIFGVQIDSMFSTETWQWLKFWLF